MSDITSNNRSKVIVRVSFIGICINVVLVGAKMFVGVLSGSIAIILDAVNNLTDALTSLITIIGTKLADRAPDKKHPYGYGRIEYITTIVISFMILIAGGSAVKESVETIINKTAAEYSLNSLIILIIALGFKLFISYYTISNGKKVESNTLIVSGQEALADAIISVGTIIALLFSVFLNISIEGFLGTLIGLGIIRSGAAMLGETLSTIIGIRVDNNLTNKVKKTVAAYPSVLGVYDVILHNYGPNSHIGSIHIEVPEDMSAKDIHLLTQRITRDIYDSMGIIVTVGIYSSIQSDSVAVGLRHDAVGIISQYPDIMQMHGFYRDEKNVGFDLVIDFKADAPKIINQVEEKLREMHPEYNFKVILDLSYSD